MVSIVAADALVLKHQSIIIHNTAQQQLFLLNWSETLHHWTKDY